ncbi:hypothetical protein DICPUDRAFT_84113 [Dictyostelium purpureum]|uniref:N-formylglutamate amidohydrolase n=1 Tax=Dictyostelium purpureum TaxID=5786 RepID=F1A1M1_DICPU|nr:uncharacterized protein DICPUDRAFT_84113 [Dictyostelium purpureum]EGC29904.1 hypothetical protein DICPUDRAFT_84113 [Dictyostelium purpureum]|eukprot:XP_003293565.1 hypothetical protein DICPUDRAFT_84113 [Dictyostelium purpureum]
MGDSNNNNNNNSVLAKGNKVLFYDDEYIFYQEGNIPMVVTFPHSGRLKIEDIPIRKSGCIDPDWYTQELAISMIQCFNCVYCCCGCNSDSSDNSSNCNNSNNSCKSNDCCATKATAKTTTATTKNENCTCCNINFDSNLVDYKQDCPRPYIVYSKIHREQCDFNRGEQRAFEDERMKPHYQLYHNTVKRFLESIKQHHKEAYEQGKVVLLDIHGQSDLKDHILRGTKDTKTCQLLLKNLGREALIGENSILGYLEKNGVKVFPNNLPSDYTTDKNNQYYIKPEDELAEIEKLKSKEPMAYFREHPEFTGSFTVMHYAEAFSINTIQVEVGYTWRSTKEHRTDFSRILRSSILNFLNSYNVN